ncbi:MAG: hypothetical protein ACHP7B_07455, partial [Burkholderiales bacterium]
LAVAPVLMTVASRPVLGQSCVAASAMGSMPTSGTHAVQFCSGLTPDQWKAIAGQWPTPYCGSAQQSTYQSLVYNRQPTLFHCPTTGFGGRVFGSDTMLNVIGLTQGGRSLDSLGPYITAALLNARAGRTPVLNETGVRNMWNDLINRGYYEPAANIRWTAANIVAYLKTTMG